MTRKLAVLAAALILTWGAGAASAGMKDDYQEPRTCGVGPFTGAYVGAYIGYGEHDVDIAAGIDAEDSTFTGGVLSGYNIQCGRLLIGYEGDISFFDTSADTSVTDPIAGTTSFESSIDWYGTSRLRLGFIHDNSMLVYVTGGLAYGDVSHKLSAPALNFSDKDSDTQYGWTIGGGVEFLRVGGWGLRAEGLYVDLGSETEHYDASTQGGTCTTDCTATAHWEDDFWVARVGLTYKFGAREEAVPLK